METAIIFAIIIIGIAAFSIGLRAKSKADTKRLFQALASRWRLSYFEGGFWADPEVSGTLEGFSVRVFKQRFSHGKTSTDTVGFAVEYPEIRRTFEIKAEGFFSRLNKLVGTGDIELHDKPFDDQALVRGGDQHEVRALLHPRAKAIIGRLIESSYANKFSLENGRLETYQVSGRFESDEALAAELETMIELGKHLTRRGSTEALLRENFLAERDPAVRAAYLESLAAVSRKDLTEDDEVIQTALQYGDPPLMFQAAKAMGPAGDRHLPGICAAADRTLTLRILGYLEDRKAKALVPDFINSADNIEDWEVKTALVRFLAVSGHPAAEAWLRRELEAGSGRPVDYRRECVRALGRCGGKPSLEFLHRLSGPPGRREIESAVAAILKRLDLTETGWLSRSDEEPGAGGLSLSGGKDK